MVRFRPAPKKLYWCKFWGVRHTCDIGPVRECKSHKFRCHRVDVEDSEKAYGFVTCDDCPAAAIYKLVKEDGKSVR